MLIKVIGCDASGKTTFIEALSKALNMPVVKGSSFEHAQCTQEELYEKFLKLAKLDNTILDRFMYCNEVYAPLYKDYAMLSDEQRRNIEEIIKEKSLLIYLSASVETLTKRLNNRGDDYVKAERIPAILKGYRESLKKIKGIHIVEFDTDFIGTDEMVDVTKQAIKALEKAGH